MVAQSMADTKVTRNTMAFVDLTKLRYYRLAEVGIKTLKARFWRVQTSQF